MSKKHKAYITTYQPIRGWTNVLMVWDEDMYTPWTTDIIIYPSYEAAVAGGKRWAEKEEVEYREPKEKSQ